MFHPNTGEIRSDGPEGIACWLREPTVPTDTDYNEESFFVCHAYFLGAGDPYGSLKISLKAEINADAWESLHSGISRPFAKPASGPGLAPRFFIGIYCGHVEYTFYQSRNAPDALPVRERLLVPLQAVNCQGGILVKRSKVYRRTQRQRVIDRKVHTLLAYGSDYLEGWSRGQNGRFAKGKIHCSCWMCRIKSYDCPSHADLKKDLAARQQMKGD